MIGVPQDYRQRILNTQVMLSLRRALYDRLLHLPLPKLWNMKTGGILSRLTGDVDTTTGLLQLAVVSPSLSLVRLVVAVGVLLALNWRLAVMALGGHPRGRPDELRVRQPGPPDLSRGPPGRGGSSARHRTWPPSRLRARRERSPRRPTSTAWGWYVRRLLTGRPPFRADDVLDTLFLVKTSEPEPPGRDNPNVDGDLETICLKCLQKEPSKRDGSAEGLADGSRALAGRRADPARPAGRVERAWRWAARRPGMASLGAAAAVLLLLVIGVLGWVLGDRATRQREAEARVLEALEAAAPALRQGNPEELALIAAVQRAERSWVPAWWVRSCRAVLSSFGGTWIC